MEPSAVVITVKDGVADFSKIGNVDVVVVDFDDIKTWDKLSEVKSVIDELNSLPRTDHDTEWNSNLDDLNARLQEIANQEKAEGQTEVEKSED